ncbi:MAG: Sapep family Mn(2+)-dependent dipeptidase [Eubacteriales bacterium]|nr:Sapep family Mn(2+)-dependent dipeptidase [Eubacteriales bacterium]MDD3197208.1 Sapep family Mn(2+)-dependent dipeptidase [Eubacteriales bacterium]MDD3502561.1 Sapep family Mn(2+)-dependent dipeptidase [Eubacteriales bacterium]MDD4681683.1 Sapep family Mn(2+)-dependent dipeptidase [Eubacteriales bacterium]
MISRQLEKFATKYDWRRHQEQDGEISLFGEFNGFLFTAMEGRGFKAFFTPVAGISNDGLSGLRSWLDNNIKNMRLRNYELSDNFLCIRLQENWKPRSVENIETVLIKLTGKLDELNLPARACAICGQPAEKSGLYVGLFCYLHPECQSKPGRDYTNSAKHSDGNYSDNIPSAEVISRLAKSMDMYRNQIIETLSEICRIPSVKGTSEPDAPYGRATADVLHKFLSIAEDLGFKTVNLDNRAGYIEWGSGSSLTAALCHLDVVPAGQGWTSEPFDVTRDADFLVGRGTVDDKGPASAVLYAMLALKEEGFKPDRRIRLIVGLDEENGSDCMEWYATHEELPANGFTADASFPVIFAEKGIVQVTLSMNEKQDETDTLQLISANAGAAANMVPGSFEAILSNHEPLLVTGRQAHASKPEEGENAIIKGVYALQRELHTTASHHPFVSAFTIMFPEDQPGSVNDFLIADDYGDLTVNPGLLTVDSEGASLTLDIRYPVTADFENDLKKPFEQLAAQAGFTCSWDKHLKPLLLEPESELVGTLSHVYQVMTETIASPEAIGGGTYARAISNIVAFGPAFPGDDDVCHQADEKIATDRLIAASAIYREALRALSTVN